MGSSRKPKPKHASNKSASKKRAANKKPKTWLAYEDVAAYLLNQFATHFKLGRLEGKQVIGGASGTEWELDAKGWSDDGKHFVIVECKRHTKSGIPQAIVAGTAWAMADTGAAAGIVVSPLGLQEGARKVAQKANIVEVILNQNSTTTDYLMQFLNRIWFGISDTAHSSISESLTITESDSGGNVISTKKIV